jgi:uncharacterized protein
MDRKDPDAIAGHRRDGYIDISISEDKLEARADFVPPIGGGKIVDVEYAEKLFAAKGITYGIDWDAVREAILECNTERKKQTCVLIASGKKPEDEIPAHYEMAENLLSPEMPEEKGGRIDYKYMSPFVMVKKGRPLAKKYEWKEGIEGTGVTGESVPPGKKEITAVKPGDGTYTGDDNMVRAAFSGRLTMQNELFFVSQVLDIKGDVDYHTGNIIFSGDITISGEIKDGFQVYAGGSVFCNETIEAADITAKKQVIAKMGILGKDKGVIRTGEDVQAKFIQHCTIKTRKDVYAQDSILNSYIKTMGKVTTGDHGKIIGGELSAIHGVAAAQIGNDAYHHTFIQCGVDFVAKKELDKIKKKHLALYLKLQKIEELYKRQTGKELKEVITKMHEQVESLVDRMNDQLAKIYQNEDAVVEVRETVFPGTAIDICHNDFIVQETMKRVRFKLDKTLGKVVAENLA